VKIPVAERSPGGLHGGHGTHPRHPPAAPARGTRPRHPLVGQGVGPGMGSRAGLKRRPGKLWPGLAAAALLIDAADMVSGNCMHLHCAAIGWDMSGHVGQFQDHLRTTS
jgi:hypothetical protein